jgi:hypothetical protein
VLKIFEVGKRIAFSIGLTSDFPVGKIDDVNVTHALDGVWQISSASVPQSEII